MTDTSAIVSDSDAQRYLIYLRDRVIDILYDKCMFLIPLTEKADLHFQTQPFDSAPACYRAATNGVYVWPPSQKLLKEMDYIAILAHEYTHNWQCKNPGQFSTQLSKYNAENIEDPENIPFEGKLFIEGCANWGASKVLDFFAADERAEQLNPVTGSPRPGDMLPDFSEYYHGFLFMVFLEYHCDFARLLYFLQTGELLYIPLGPVNPEEGFLHLKGALDYERYLYPDGRLGISSMCQIPGDWKPEDGLCSRQAGYKRYPHSAPCMRDCDSDYPRRTYLLRRFRNGRRNILPDGDQFLHPGAEEGARFAESFLHMNMDQLLHVGRTDGGLTSMHEDLIKLSFCCPECNFRKDCTVMDACNLHSCGLPDRNRSALLAALNKVKDNAEQPRGS